MQTCTKMKYLENPGLVTEGFTSSPYFKEYLDVLLRIEEMS